MVTADGRVKIADFGIAKATTQMQTGAFLTATGTTVGTPTYMAPEQAMAQDIGPWTDLYSVGCMAFEMFTGRVPFHDSEAPMAILLRHVNEPIPPRQVDRPDDRPGHLGLDRARCSSRTRSSARSRPTTRGTSSRRSSSACSARAGAARRGCARARAASRHADAADARAVPGHDGRRRGLRRVPVLRLGQRGHARRASRPGDPAAVAGRCRSRPIPVVGPPTPEPGPAVASDGTAPPRRPDATPAS